MPYRHIGELVIRRAHLAVAMHTELAESASAARQAPFCPATRGTRASLRRALAIIARRLAGLATRWRAAA